MVDGGGDRVLPAGVDGDVQVDVGGDTPTLCLTPVDNSASSHPETVAQATYG